MKVSEKAIRAEGDRWKEGCQRCSLPGRQHGGPEVSPVFMTLGKEGGILELNDTEFRHLRGRRSQKEIKLHYRNLNLWAEI